jgi:hypothetical protein
MIKVLVVVAAFLCSLSSSGQTKPAVDQRADDLLLRLPRDLKLKEDGPQKYLLTCDYFNLDTMGNLMNKERVSGQYTRGLPDGSVRWSNVRIANAKAFDDAFPEGELQKYMEGFTYNRSTGKSLFDKEFFEGFPTAAFLKTKNIVWDMHMIEDFAWNYFDNLELNRPHATQSQPEDVPLAGDGVFQNRKIEITWVGISKMNEKTCALIRYEALFNKLKVSIGKISVQGRSHYWGEIWVSLTDKQLEFATLLEDVLTDVNIPQQSKMLVNSFRKMTFEKTKPAKS